MKSIREVADQPLQWTQPKTLKREYELRAGNDVVAFLRWEKASGSLAVTVRLAGSESEVAVFRPTGWGGQGVLECTNLPESRALELDLSRADLYNKRGFLGSSAVEQPAVNRWVAGSNPARGATGEFFVIFLFEMRLTQRIFDLLQGRWVVNSRGHGVRLPVSDLTHRTS